ncbi:unnamed protein product [Dicrocoelium dendriticum]|nr:unnamed protein product [Dicrocoelium dendriticum]
MNYFHLTGEMPHCNEDFLDVYIDVASSSLDIDRESALLSYLASGEPHTTTPFSAATYSSVLDQSALLGRYCGGHSSHRPTVFISLHREIVLDFYASTNRINNNRIYSSKQTYGFNGSFEFISDAVFYPGRALSANEMRLPYKFPTTSSCRFRVTSNAERIVDQDFSSPQSSDTTGELISPTYPGFHPDGLFCLYQLVGTQTQRINIDVLDVDLPTQDSTCPIDYLNFYDGLSMEASKSILGTPFCGSGKRIRIVSSGSAFLILFVTGTWSAISWDESGTGSRSKRQGFRLLYHFSETFLPISLKYSMNHIRGTECDYLIRSHGLTEATFESPTSKGGRLLYPDRLCTFYFMGTFERQYLETVRITFDHLVLPKPSGSGER